MSPITDVAISATAATVESVINVARALSQLQSAEVEPGPGVGGYLIDRGAAIEAYKKALDATVKYLKETERDPTSRSEDREYELADMWNNAGGAISRFDPELGNRCYVKGQGWLDSRVWQDPRFKAYGVSIDDMRLALLEFNRSENAPILVPRWFPILGAIFAILTFTTLLYLLLGPTLPADRHIIFNVWMAFCIACSGAFIGGSASAQGKLQIPYMKDAPIQFSAVGGFALFVVAFLILRYANP
jgi:hypothetical protein